MLGAIEGPWTQPRWAVIKDARRRQRRRRRRFIAVLTALLLVGAVGWASANNSRPGPTPTPRPVMVGTVEQLRLGGVVQDTTTLDGQICALNCLRHCSEPSTASAGQLIELTANGQPIKRVPVSDPTVLTSGAGAIWVAHFDTGDISRINPQTGQTTATTHLRFAKPITTNGWRRFEPSAISFGAGRVWVSDGLGYIAEINPGTARLERIVFTSSEAPSSTSAAGLRWVADELDGVGTFAAGSDHVAVHHISWAGQPVDVRTVAYGAGLIWALGTETNYSMSLTHPPTVGVVTTLNPHTGRVVYQWRISPQASALVPGNGGAYVSDGNKGRLLRLTTPHGIQILHGPKALQLTAVTSHALWAIAGTQRSAVTGNKIGQLLRIGLVRR